MAGQFFPSGWGTEKGTQQSISKKRETEHGLQRNHMSRGMSLRRTDTHSIVDDRINQMRLAAYLSALGGTASDPLPVWSTDKTVWMGKNRENGASVIGFPDLGSARSAGSRSNLPSGYFPILTPESNHPRTGYLLPDYIPPAFTFPITQKDKPALPDNTVIIFLTTVERFLLPVTSPHSKKTIQHNKWFLFRKAHCCWLES